MHPLLKKILDPPLIFYYTFTKCCKYSWLKGLATIFNLSNLSKIDFKALSLGHIAFARSEVFSGCSGQGLLLMQSQAIFFQCYANSLLRPFNIFLLITSCKPCSKDKRLCDAKIVFSSSNLLK